MIEQTAEQERAHWDAVAMKPLDELRAEIWNEPHIENAWEARLSACLDEVLPAVAPRLRAGATMLDLGCGAGRLTLPIAQGYGSVVHLIGVDISDAMLGRARHEATQRKLRNAQFLVCDGRTLPVLPALDAAYSMIMFQHIPKQCSLSYIVQVARILRRGGRFRFQFVEGDDEGFLSHGLGMEWVKVACESSGLDIVACDRGRVYPQWTWITAEKRGA